ncbi:hypothetical protein AAG906_006758 [Vitis piasezkii]
MASFAKHLSLLLLIVLLSDSVGRSYGRDSFYFSKVAPNSVDKENDVADLFDHDEPAFSQLSKQEDHSNGDDEKLTISLRAYEQGIKYAELVKNKMNSYGVKAVNTNGFNDDGVKIAKSATSKDIKDDKDAAAAAADDDEKLTKSLRAYEQGIKYAELVKNKMNSYGVKAVNNNGYNDDGDYSLNDALTAYARGVKIAKSATSKDIKDDKDAAAAAADDDEKLTKSLRAYEQGIKYAELVKNKMNGYGVKAVNNNGYNDDGDYSLNDALTAYARGVKIAKSATSKDIKDDEDAAAAADDEQLTKSLRAYGQGIQYAELVKNKMNSYGVKAVNNYDNNDDGDNSLNNALTAYARGGKIAKWVMSKDIKDAAAAAADDNSLNNALTAYARGVEIAKSIKNNDVDVNDINNSEVKTYQQWVKAYEQWINQAKSVKNENAEDDVHDIVDIKDPKIKAAYEQGVKYAKYLNDEDMP